MIVADASVVVKWFVSEPFSDEAESLLASHLVRIAPEHVLVAVGQALLRYHRAERLPQDHCRDALDSIGRLVQLVPTRKLASSAFDIAVEVRCTQYDALYLALAELTNATLMTADLKLISKLRMSRWRGRVRSFT